MTVNDYLAQGDWLIQIYSALGMADLQADNRLNEDFPL